MREPALGRLARLGCLAGGPRLQALELGLQYLDVSLGPGKRGAAPAPGMPGAVGGTGADRLDRLDDTRTTATPLAIASSTAPDMKNKIPYRAVSRTRTVRPGNRSLASTASRRLARIRLSSRRQCPDQGVGPVTSACPGCPNNGITARVRPMLWPFP